MFIIMPNRKKTRRSKKRIRPQRKATIYANQEGALNNEIVDANVQKHYVSSQLERDLSINLDGIDISKYDSIRGLCNLEKDLEAEEETQSIFDLQENTCHDDTQNKIESRIETSHVNKDIVHGHDIFEFSIFYDKYTFFQPPTISVHVYPFLTKQHRQNFEPLLQYEYLRILTFHWSKMNQNSENLVTDFAAQGYYCSGFGEITCFHCGRKFQMGAPLESSHDSHCQWKEVNKPLICGTEGLDMNSIEKLENIFKGHQPSSARQSLQVQGVNVQNNISAEVTLSHQLPTNSSASCITDFGTNEPDGNFLSLSSFLTTSTQSDNGNSSPRDDEDFSNNDFHKSRLETESSPSSSTFMLTSATQSDPYDVGNLSLSLGSSDWDLSNASYPQYADRMARWRTFTSWSPDHTQKPEQLVDLGFFYSGK